MVIYGVNAVANVLMNSMLLSHPPRALWREMAIFAIEMDDGGEGDGEGLVEMLMVAADQFKDDPRNPAVQRRRPADKRE